MARKLRCCRARSALMLASIGWAFDATVPTLIIVGPVAIFFAVRFVMLLVVTDQIAQREAIVRGDEVDARARAPAVVGKEIAAAGEPRSELADRAAVAFPEPPDTIAILAVPFAPEHGKIADLITMRSDVPRLGDQLHFGKNRVLLNDIEEGAEPIDFPELTRERAGEIEAKTIDVHLGHPIPQRIHDELERARMTDVKRIPAAGEIDVVAPIGVEAVIGGVVDARETRASGRARCPRRCDCKRRRE